MKRLSIGLAIVSLVAIVQLPAGASCLPAGNEFFCQYLKLPQTACFTVVNQSNVPQQVRDAKLCEKIPIGVVVAGQDLNIVNAGSSVVGPDGGSVGINRSIFIHNLDLSNAHTFTSTETGCMDTSTTTFCRFDKPLGIGDWGMFAATLQITTSRFAVGVTYGFRCKLHGGETGTFTVTT